MLVFSIAMVYTTIFFASSASSVWRLADADAGLQYNFSDHPTAITAGQVIVCELDPWWLRMIKYEWNHGLLYPDHLSYDHSISFFFPPKMWNFCWGVVVMSLLFVAPLSLTLAISPLQFTSVAPLLRDSWVIVDVSPLCCHNFVLHISHATRTTLLLNCASTILNNRATVRLAATMNNIFFIVVELGECAPDGRDKKQWWGNY